MKKHIITIGIFATTLLFSGCNDEFLERYPLDRITN